MARNDPATPPDPAGGWSYSLKDIPRAIVVPHEKAAHDLSCGVFTAAGQYVPRAATWQRESLITHPPGQVPPVVDTLDGEWLWGGVLYGHFGHFITESSARLWVVPALRERLKGVIFVEKYSSEHRGLPGYVEEFFRLLIGDLPVRFLREATQVERLHIPGQGFGIGRMSKGTRVFRRFIAEHFARDVAPEGPENLFLTRSQLALDREGFVGEAIFDDRMARAGYEVFSPERHDLTTQIARYRAAKRIVGMDGSAFHLYGLVAREDQNVGVILRRQRGRSRAMCWQIESFAGRPPHVIDTLKRNREWVVGKKSAIQDFDMERVGNRLKKSGLIDAGFDWGPLTSEEEAFAAAELAAEISADRSA